MLGNFVSDLIKTAIVDLVFKRPIQFQMTRDQAGRMDVKVQLNPSGDRNQQQFPQYMPGYPGYAGYAGIGYAPGYLPGYSAGYAPQPWAPPQAVQQVDPNNEAAARAQAQQVVASLPQSWRS